LLAQDGQPPLQDDEGEGYATVGAVARDAAGGLAAATSTGGITFTPPGRVGDSPLPGAGLWADSRAAASGTGDGEQIARVLLCRRAVDLLGEDVPADPDDAAQAALDEMERTVGGTAGLIVVDQTGRTGVAYNTEVMGHAWRSEGMDEPICEGTSPEPVAG
jgi:beta-aspartyl-peptidase (threonine type)